MTICARCATRIRVNAVPFRYNVKQKQTIQKIKNNTYVLQRVELPTCRHIRRDTSRM